LSGAREQSAYDRHERGDLETDEPDKLTRDLLVQQINPAIHTVEPAVDSLEPPIVKG